MKNIFNSLIIKSLNFLLLAALVFNAADARANMAAPSRGGRMLGEPNGLEKIYIRHETLTVDFRQLEDKSSDGKISVEAVYEVENKGDAKPLELVFALGAADVSEFSFWLDEAPVRTEMKQTGELPKNWEKPQNTPWVGGKEIYYSPMIGDYSGGNAKNATISVTIPPGNHRLKAAYKAEPTRYYGNAPVLLYQFAYILAPAKEWAGFDGLDVTVNYPAGWQIVTKPDLEQNGENLTKHFSAIPSDALTFTLGKPMPQGYYLLDNSLFFLFLFCLFGIPLVMIFFAVRNARKTKHLQPASGLLWSLLWAGMTGLTGFAAIFGADYFYPSISYGYGEVFALFGLIAVCFAVFIVGSAAWAIGAVLFNNRKTAG